MARAETSRESMVWAFDPFADAEVGPSLAAPVLKYFNKKLRVKIEAVYVMSPDSLNWHGEFSKPWVDKYSALAEAAAKKSLKTAGLSPMIVPKVLINKEISEAKDIDKLISYAKKQHAKMIVVTTHARTGFSRAIFGSFSESLLLKSKVPVLFVNPKLNNAVEFKHILYVTDFSKQSKKAFRSIVQLCKELGSELSIYHKVTYPVEPIAQSGVYIAGGGWITLKHYMGDLIDRRKASMKKLVEEAEKQGVKTSFEVDEQDGSILESISEYAKSIKANMIAMASVSGTVSSVVLGSLTRDVIRNSKVPVWVMHQ